MSRAQHRSLLPPPQKRAAFTLIEIVLSLAIVATIVVGIIGVLPAGLSASREAVNHTVVAMILEELHNRLQNEELKSKAEPYDVSFSPARFDDQGIFIPQDAPPEKLARALYYAEVKVGVWETRPAHTSGLRPITISLSWPVNPATGNPIGTGNPQTVVTYAATTLTGPDWQVIDPTYRPKIQF
jgi:uncharacterized protein (TIGR02598 family)